MNREVHVRFCESRGVRFPPATRLPPRGAVRGEVVELPQKIVPERQMAVVVTRCRLARCSMVDREFLPW